MLKSFVRRGEGGGGHVSSCGVSRCVEPLQAGETIDVESQGMPPAVTQQYGNGEACRCVLEREIRLSVSLYLRRLPTAHSLRTPPASSERGGSPRETMLRFECVPSANEPGFDENDDAGNGAGDDDELSLVSLSEPESCRYLVVLGTPRVCEHPRVAASRGAPVALTASPPSELACYPMPRTQHAHDEGGLANGPDA
jgi:hypothetical protein